MFDDPVKEAPFRSRYRGQLSSLSIHLCRRILRSAKIPCRATIRGRVRRIRRLGCSWREVISRKTGNVNGFGEARFISTINHRLS